LVDGNDSFRMTCSFHSPEDGDEYQLPMATDIPNPEAISGVEAPFPFDVREIGPTEQRDDGSYLSTRRCWFRTREPLPDDPVVHACLLAYFSDMTAASFRPGSMSTWGTHTDASLDHALWFHRKWRADAWSFFDIHAVVNSGGRAAIRATMHGEDGVLHLSMAQELLIRRLETPLVFERPRWLDSASGPSEGLDDEDGHEQEDRN
jgi:acyl-CoA thioesterase-2